MATKATDRHPIEAKKGAFAVPNLSTSQPATIPATIATQVLEVVIVLKMPLRSGSEFSSISLLNSATSQLSKTLHNKVPEIPPSTRPRNSTVMLSVNRAADESEYIAQ